MANSWDKIKKASKMVNNIIESAIAVPENQNMLKKQQLRELAAINGSLRDEEITALEPVDVTQLITGEDTTAKGCPICSGEHTATDCPNKANPEFASKVADQQALLEEEYQKLMNNIQDTPMEDTAIVETEDIPPWRRDEMEKSTYIDDPYLAFYGLVE